MQWTKKYQVAENTSKLYLSKCTSYFRPLPNAEGSGKKVLAQLFPRHNVM